MDRKPNLTRLLFLLITPAIVLYPYFSSTGLAKTVTLGWDANSEPDLEGYAIYRNPDSSGPPYKYDDTLPEDDLSDPLHPMVTLTGLNEKTKYYVAVTAYDAEGNESYFSNEICFEVVDSTISNCTTSSTASGSSSGSSGGGSGGGGGGGGGGWCFISSVADESNGLPVMFFVLVVVGLVLSYKARRLKGGKPGGWNDTKKLQNPV
jgi:uncharacterized membrane protein YgcG